MPRQLLALLAAVGILAGCATGATVYEGRSYPRYGVFDRGSDYRYGSRDAERYHRSRGRTQRLVRPDDDVVCDRRTRVCYKDGAIDKSETRDYFGSGAAGRADRVRDRYGEDAFVLGGRAVCDRDDRVCYRNGRPDRGLTRDQFGKKAARRVGRN